jgi:hypothetical protein
MRHADQGQRPPFTLPLPPPLVKYTPEKPPTDGKTVTGAVSPSIADESLPARPVTSP